VSAVSYTVGGCTCYHHFRPEGFGLLDAKLAYVWPASNDDEMPSCKRNTKTIICRPALQAVTQQGVPTVTSEKVCLMFLS